MRYDETNEIRDLAFDFFYWFSRFEFALKEAGYLKNSKPGFVAEPGWDKFVSKWKADYKISEKASKLLAS